MEEKSRATTTSLCKQWSEGESCQYGSEQLYKTVLCNNWEAEGKCQWEEQCKWAHGKEDLQASGQSQENAQAVANAHSSWNSQHKTVLCNMWAEGACQYGSNCMFAHGLAELNERAGDRQGGVVIINPQYKTILCQQTGCQFGETCSFAHSQGEVRTVEQNLVQMNQNYKRTLCKYFMSKGECEFGSICQYAHGNTEVRKIDMGGGMASKQVNHNYSQQMEHITCPQYKTTICKKCQHSGKCDFGARCQFAHGQLELRTFGQNYLQLNPQYKTAMCSHFTEHGSCSQGHTCQFSHGMQELRQTGGQDMIGVDSGQSNMLEGSDVFEFTEIGKIKVATTETKQNPLQKATCCNNACMDQDFNQQLESKLREIKGKSSAERKQYLLDHLIKQEELDIATHGFQFYGFFFCKKSLAKISGISEYIITEASRAFEAGQITFVHGNTTGMRESEAGLGFVIWMKLHAVNYGNEAPDEPTIVLPACFSQKDLFQQYLTEAPKPLIQRSTFYRLFKLKFGPHRDDKSLPHIRISSYSTHSKCDQCILIEKFQKTCKNEQDVAFSKSLKQAHKQIYQRCYRTIQEKRHKALYDPENYVCVQVDDMDNYKSHLPQAPEIGKTSGSLFRLPTKVTGCIIWSGKYPQNRKVVFYINHNQYEQSGSKLVSFLFKLLQKVVEDFGKLPRNLFINLDNCWRENKNIFVFSFLSALIELKIFATVEVDFMLVGHTGNQVDQLFSILTREFKSEMRCPDDLTKKILNAPITPKPVVEELLYTWDWRSFITPNLTGKKLKNHSFYHSFQLKKETDVVFRAKKYSFSPDWIPDGGIRLLNRDIEFTPVEASDFRLESLNIDKVFSDLYTKYFPTLDLLDRKEAEASWEKLRSVLENLPRRQNNLAPMRLQCFPKQVFVTPNILPDYLQPFDSPDTPELIGEHCIVEPEESQFLAELKPGMDIAVYTESKKDRPWLGRVLKIQSDSSTFEAQWYKRRGRSATFQALFSEDGTAYSSTLDANTVMLWEFGDNKTDNSFDISREWFAKIMEEYRSHDACYHE